MGAKPIEIDPGDDCALCYPAGETPEKLHVFFGGISMGQGWFPGLPVPPNGYFILPQNAIVPCRFDLATPDFLLAIWYHANFSLCTCETTGFFTVFDGFVVPTCEKYFVNLQVDGPMSAYYGGFAFITTMGDIVDKISGIIPYIADGARFEVYPLAGEILHIRYANRKHRQNILVEVPAD